MLNKEIESNQLFSELSVIADSMNLYVVDVVKTLHGRDVNISVAIQLKDGEVSIDDCENFHRTIQPQLELQYGRENLSIEVSTPGIQRVFRDFYEFKIFKGKRVRLYCLSKSSWLTGIIGESFEDSVILSDVFVEDTNEKSETIKIEYNDIQKAKLDFSFPSAKEKKNV